MIEFLVSLNVYIDFCRTSRDQALEWISYRALSYIDARIDGRGEDIDDKNWFDHPEIRAEYEQQIASFAPTNH